MLFRVELARPLPADKNRLNVIQKRVEYGNWFIHLAIVRHCMFVDECGYNIWTARSHRRASIGEGTYRQLCVNSVAETLRCAWRFPTTMAS